MPGAPPADPPRLVRHHRCANCQAPMPADLGIWIIALRRADRNTDTLILLCSRECEEQL